MQIAPSERWRVKAASLRLLAGSRLTGAQRRLLSQFIDVYLRSWEQRGWAEGQRDLVERLPIRKLGPLSDATLARLVPLSSSQLTALGEALLDFTAPGDLAAWLVAPPPPQDDDAAPEITCRTRSRSVTTLRVGARCKRSAALTSGHRHELSSGCRAVADGGLSDAGRHRGRGLSWLLTAPAARGGCSNGASR